MDNDLERINRLEAILAEVLTRLDKVAKDVRLIAAPIKKANKEKKEDEYFGKITAEAHELFLAQEAKRRALFEADDKLIDLEAEMDKRGINQDRHNLFRKPKEITK